MRTSVYWVQTASLLGTDCEFTGYRLGVYWVQTGSLLGTDREFTGYRLGVFSWGYHSPQFGAEVDNM